MNNAARIASIGTALPPCKITQDHALSMLIEHYESILTPRTLSAANKLFSHPSIKNRRFSFKNKLEIASMKNENPDKRITRFTDWAVHLSSQAVLSAMKPLPISTDDITCLIVNTCTGYICPGISTYLIEKLKLNSNIKAFDLVGAGCGGAIPNLQLGSMMAMQGEIVLCVSVEICSATFEMDNDLSLIVSNAIFGDGAAAAVLWNKDQGIKLVDTASIFFPQYREYIRYVHKNGHLHNQLSVLLPKIIGTNVPQTVRSIINKNNLSLNQIDHWAIHPGGDKILNCLQEELNISHEKMMHSRNVLEKNGNMSSPTILFILKEIIEKETIADGSWGIAVSFGAGLSIYTWLLYWD